MSNNDNESRTAAPVSSNPECARCEQVIYPLELKGQIMGLKYHKQCFKCYTCDRNLEFKNYKTNMIDLNDKSIYCSSHAPKNGKGSIDFQAIDNLPKNITKDYESQRRASIGSNASVRSHASNKSVEKTANFLVKNVINKSIEKSLENLADASDDDDDVKQATAVVITADNTRGLSSGEEELQWKEIYDKDGKIELDYRLETQLSNDSAFYKRSTEKLDRIKWEYLDFKAGNERPNQAVIRKTPDIYRKQYGPWDSAYKSSTFDYGKATWKEIFENNDKTTLRQVKKSNLDLLDRDELTWREIYERDYRGFKKASTENIVQEVTVEIEPEIEVTPEPIESVEKVIDSLSYDSSVINKIPSKESIKEAGDYRNRDRIKSDSYVSTKETTTYHHQLSDQSTQKHVSVMVPMIINNRESAIDNDTKTINIPKSTSDEASAEQRKKMLDELMKQKVQETVSKTDKKEEEDEVKKVIEPAVVIPSKPVVMEQIKPVIIKETRIIGENKGYGVVKLTVHYDELRNRLSITIHQAQNLKNVEKNEKKNDLSDPYVRIYLVPDEKKTFKRKTKVVKNNLNPKWEETFDYKLTYEQSLGKDLIVSLKDDKKGLFSKQETRMLGEVRLRLADLGIKRPYTRWFFLQPLGAVSKLLLNSGINPYKK